MGRPFLTWAIQLWLPDELHSTVAFETSFRRRFHVMLAVLGAAFTSWASFHSSYLVH